MGSVKSIPKAETFDELGGEITDWMVRYEVLQEIQDHLMQTYQTDLAPALEDIDDIIVTLYRLGYVKFEEN